MTGPQSSRSHPGGSYVAWGRSAPGGEMGWQKLHKLYGFKPMKAAETHRLEKFHSPGCGRILMCGFGLSVLRPLKSLLGSLANLPGSAASAPDAEEKRKSSSCALLWGRVLTWIFSWVLTLPCAPGIPREHVWPRFVGLALIWVSLYLYGTCSAFFEYHGFLVPACFYVNCLGWETSEGWVYRKKKCSQVTSFQHAFHRGNESSLCRKKLLTNQTV